VIYAFSGLALCAYKSNVYTRALSAEPYSECLADNVRRVHSLSGPILNLKDDSDIGVIGKEKLLAYVTGVWSMITRFTTNNV
jgi:hypothetical protein